MRYPSDTYYSYKRWQAEQDRKRRQEYAKGVAGYWAFFSGLFILLMSGAYHVGFNQERDDGLHRLMQYQMPYVDEQANYEIWKLHQKRRDM